MSNLRNVNINKLDPGPISKDTKDWVHKRQQLDLERRQQLVVTQDLVSGITQAFKEMDELKAEGGDMKQKNLRLKILDTQLKYMFQLLKKVLPDMSSYDPDAVKSLKTVSKPVESLTIDQLEAIVGSAEVDK